MRPQSLWLALLLVCSSALADPSIQIDGVNSAVATNIRNHLGAISANEEAEPRLLKQKIKASVEQASQALGYYQTQFQYTLEKNTITITVEPGPAVVWAAPDIQIEGAATELAPIRDQVQKSPFTAGAVINHQIYENYKRHLLELCQEWGFLDARLEQSRLVVDLQQHTASAILRISAGKRYRITDIEFTGSKLDKGFVKRLTKLRAGNFIRKSELIQLHRDLQGARYFRDIDIQTDRLDDEHIRIVVRLIDAPNHQLSVGIGFGTDTGPRTKLRWERPQATAGGDRFTTELSLSQPQQSLTAEYVIPLTRPLQQTINFTTSWVHTSVEDTSSTIGSIGSFYSDHYQHDWVGSYGVTFDNESYRQGSEPRTRVQYFLPGFNFTQVVLPSGIDPTQGHRTWLAVTASTPALGADTAFVHVDTGYKRLFNPFGQQLLIVRAEVGAISTADIEQIPSSQRFFTGGDQTVRGYDFDSLGPRDASDELIGGRYLNVGSLEYSFKVAPTWRAAVFTDTGRAFNELNESFHSSAGFGVRWLSPVGQIRVDLAFPINTAERSWRLHIFMGPPL